MYDWNWKRVNKQIQIDPPYATSLICAIRCSKLMVTVISDYAKKYNNLFMDEALFNTLALHNNLSVITIPEFSTIEWRKIWNVDDINKDNLYHPIKCISMQCSFREHLENTK